MSQALFGAARPAGSSKCSRIISSTAVATPASDSGASDSDNITNLSTVTFRGTTAPGTTVTILRGGGVSNLETIQTEIFNVLNGRADQIREFLRRYEEMGVDQIIFVSQAGKNRHEDIMAISARLIGLARSAGMRPRTR